MNCCLVFMNHILSYCNLVQGNVTLVTVEDSGIGRAVCLYFAMKGATVTFTYGKGQEDKDA